MKVGDFVMVRFSAKDICFAKIIELSSSQNILVKLIGDDPKNYELTVGLSIVTILTDEEAMLKRLEYSE
jgi:16S rRNA U1498 N3-methylase RsmE